jgi:DNA end-binding protein Ku
MTNRRNGAKFLVAEKITGSGAVANARNQFRFHLLTQVQAGRHMRQSVRTFWKGYLRLALVNIPIRLVSAERTEATVHFHQVDRKSRQRIRYVKVAPGRGEVKKDDIVLAYEIEPGNYVFIEDEDLNALKLSTRHTVELTQFVAQDEIDPLYFERPYYVLPDGEVAEEGYTVIRDALKASKKVGVGQLTLRGRENLVALYPGGGGLILDTLRYESELKDADEIFQGIRKGKVSKDMEAMAEQLIEQKSQPFDASQFKNHYAEALRELVQRKIEKGGKIAVDEEELGEGAKVIDFMDALKRSLGKPDAGASSPDAASGKTSDQAAKRKAPARKAAAKAARRKA